MWTILRWNLPSHISRSKFKFSNIVPKSSHAPPAGRGRVWGLRLTMLPLSTQSHIIALLPSNEKSFTLYDGFGKSALLWSFEPRNLWRKIHLWVAAVFEKCYFVILRGTKEGQECASRGHPEIFSISSGESQRKSGSALKKPERYKRY